MRAWTAFEQVLDRMIASDPGLARLHRALRVTAAVVFAVLLMLTIVLLVPNSLRTAPMLAGMMALIGSVAVNDPTIKEQKITTWLLLVPAAISILIGAVLATNAIGVDIALLVIIFVAFYIQNYGPRYLAIGMISFMSLYFSSLLHIQFHQIPWLYGGLLVGPSSAFVFRFWILRERPEKMIRRSIEAFHIRSNATLNLLIELVTESAISEKSRLKLRRYVTRMHECSTMVTSLLGTEGTNASENQADERLRLYLFDTEIVIETMIDAARRLDKRDILSRPNVQQAVLSVLVSVRDLLAYNPDTVRIDHARATLQILRNQVTILETNHATEEWLYLLRRMESVAEHLVDETSEIQKIRLHNLETLGQAADEEVADTKEDKPKKWSERLQPATQNAVRGLIAGLPAIIIGHYLSPAHAYWSLLSAFVVLMGTGTVGRTFVKAFQRSIGTLLGAIVGYGLALVTAGHIEIEMLSVFFCIFMAFFLMPVSYAWMVFWITIMLSSMYDLLLGGVHVQLLEDRFVDTVIGVALGWLVSSFVFPNRTRNETREAMANFLGDFKAYVTTYLDSVARPDEVHRLTGKVFELTKQLEAMRESTRTLRQLPGSRSRSDIERKLLILMELNYYARQLENPTNFGAMCNIPGSFTDCLEEVAHRVASNLDALSKLLRTTRDGKFQDLEELRARIERSSEVEPGNKDQDMLHRSLRYIWRINKAVLYLARDLGAKTP